MGKAVEDKWGWFLFFRRGRGLDEIVEEGRGAVWESDDRCVKEVGLGVLCKEST